MFYEDDKFSFNKRNKDGEYNNTVLRSMLVDEVKILFEAQRNLGNLFATKEFENEFLEIMTFQKDFMTTDLLEKMLGKCTFEKEEPRAPKNSYTFERFALLSKINHLKIYRDGKTGEKTSLTEAERKIVENMAYEQAEVKYTQIRRKLELSDDAKFADLTYWVKNTKDLPEEELVKKVEDTKFVKLEGWNKIRLALKNKEKFEQIKQNPEIQDRIADALVRNKTDDSIREYLENEQIDQEIVEAILSINFTKFGHLSYKAMKKSFQN